MSLMISASKYEPDLLLGFPAIVIAAWLSVYIRTSLLESSSSCCAILSARGDNDLP